MSEPAKEVEPIIVKKYANRRLYNTATSSYVTLETLAQMVKDGTDFVVRDAKSNDDITRAVLTQIIFEEEGKGHNLLPISFLRQLIRFYDDSLRGLVPGYLELSMNNFSKNQEEIRAYVSNTFGDLFPFKQFEDMGRKNVQMFQSALQMFSPFAADDKALPPQGIEEPAPQQGEIGELKEQVARLQEQIEKLLANKA